jgi:hypothetical protein
VAGGEAVLVVWITMEDGWCGDIAVVRAGVLLVFINVIVSEVLVGCLVVACVGQVLDQLCKGRISLMEAFATSQVLVGIITLCSSSKALILLQDL